MELGMLNNEKEMFLFLRQYLEEKKLHNSQIALPYAVKKHVGVFREGGKPYIVHPLFVAVYGILIGLSNDEQIAISLLHDVPEDCDDDLRGLNVSPYVKQMANLLNFNVYKKRENYVKAEAMAEYHENILPYAESTMTKFIDRLHNLSTMHGPFPKERKLNYILETQQFFYPDFERAIELHSQYEAQIIQLRFQIQTIVDVYRDQLAPEENPRKLTIA